MDYTQITNYNLYLFDQLEKQYDLNRYLDECSLISTNTNTSENIYLIESEFGDKIKSLKDKTLALITKIWNKFLETMNRLIKSDKDYLEKYKDIIQNKPPIKAEYSIYNYKDGINKIKSMNVPEFNYNNLKENLESKEKFIEKYFSDIVAGQKPPYDNFSDICKSAFRGGSEPIKIESNNLDMKEMYKYCIEYQDIKNYIEKDINYVKNACEVASNLLTQMDQKQQSSKNESYDFFSNFEEMILTEQDIIDINKIIDENINESKISIKNKYNKFIKKRKQIDKQNKEIYKGYTRKDRSLKFGLKFTYKNFDLLMDRSVDLKKTGNYKGLRPNLLEMAKRCTTLDEINYLRRNINSAIKTVSIVMKNKPEFKSQCEEHIKWLKTDYKDALNKRATEIRKSSIKESYEYIEEGTLENIKNKLKNKYYGYDITNPNDVEKYFKKEDPEKANAIEIILDITALILSLTSIVIITPNPILSILLSLTSFGIIKVANSDKVNKAYKNIIKSISKLQNKLIKVEKDVEKKQIIKQIKDLEKCKSHLEKYINKRNNVQIESFVNSDFYNNQLKNEANNIYNKLLENNISAIDKDIFNIFIESNSPIYNIPLYSVSKNISTSKILIESSKLISDTKDFKISIEEDNDNKYILLSYRDFDNLNESYYSKVYDRYIHEEEKNNNENNTQQDESKEKQANPSNAYRQVSDSDKKSNDEMIEKVRGSVQTDDPKKAEQHVDIYNKVCIQFIAAKQTCAENAYKSYMDIIRMHVKDYINGKTNSDNNQNSNNDKK